MITAPYYKYKKVSARKERKDSEMIQLCSQTTQNRTSEPDKS